MKARWTALLVVAVALVAAAPAMGARLDPSFGRDGSYAVATPKYNGETAFTRMHLAVAPGGSSYVQQGSWIYAFGANGRPYLGFGDRGRLLVAPKAGKLTELGDVAVDSRGRVLVTGTLVTAALAGSVGSGSPPKEAFVIRYRPDGSLDPTFGSGGEVDTTFGVPEPAATPELPPESRRPSIEARRIAVDAEDRPVVAAEATVSTAACYDNPGAVRQAILARLNPDGSIDTSFGGSGTGYVDLASEAPTGLTAAPAGGWATLSGRLCANGEFALPAQVSVLDEGGVPLASLDPARRPLRAGPRSRSTKRAASSTRKTGPSAKSPPGSSACWRTATPTRASGRAAASGSGASAANTSAGSRSTSRAGSWSTSARHSSR
jgi:uncharacterized delta-60 repeat protein